MILTTKNQITTIQWLPNRETQITKANQLTKKIVFIVMNNHGISNCYQKQRDEEYQRYKDQRLGTPQQSFVQYFRSKPSNSQENRNEKKNDYSSRDNDRNRYNQNNYS